MNWLKKLKRSITMGQIIAHDLDKIIANIEKSELPEAQHYVSALLRAASSILQKDLELHGPSAS